MCLAKSLLRRSLICLLPTSDEDRLLRPVGTVLLARSNYWTYCAGHYVHRGTKVQSSSWPDRMASRSAVLLVLKTVVI